LDQSGERTLLIAGVRDEESLRELIKKRMGLNLKSNRTGDAEMLEDSKGEWAARLSKDLVVMGAPADVRSYIENFATTRNDEYERKMTFFVPFSSPASIVTYTDDSDRIANFVSAVLAAKGSQSIGSIESMIAELPYSATETTLGDRGFERVTKSPLGQFATLLPLVIPSKSTETKK